MHNGYGSTWRGGYGYGRGWGGYGWRGSSYYGWGWPYYYSGWPYVVSGFSYGWGDPYYDSWDRTYSPYYSYPAYSYGPSYAYAQQSPVVVVNQTPPSYSAPPPPAREYRDDRDEPEARTPAYRTPVYKLAFQDHRIVSALAYWVKDGRLHYVSTDHEMRDVPLASVDRRFSEQLNRDLGLSFRLPAE